jgi:hypothetical protein
MHAVEAVGSLGKTHPIGRRLLQMAGYDDWAALEAELRAATKRRAAGELH